MTTVLEALLALILTDANALQLDVYIFVHFELVMNLSTEIDTCA